mmetsp:Transcript_18385/g.31308  ORF Transcript_18385/g.31308 Transcript_18385/m.31308 type:complete len:247 (+) Transcript_18385:102-842(+)
MMVIIIVIIIMVIMSISLSKHYKKPKAKSHHVGQSVLRHVHRRRAGRPHRDDAARGRRPQDGRELPRALHRREGLWLQGLQLPPRHHVVHVPGRRLHEPQRHGRQVDLRRQVRRRELPAQAHGPGRALDGQRRPRHQRLAVLPLHRQDRLARRQARRLRLGHWWHGGREGDRGRWQPERQDVQAGRDRRLRPVVSPVRGSRSVARTVKPEQPLERSGVSLSWSFTRRGRETARAGRCRARAARSHE